MTLGNLAERLTQCAGEFALAAAATLEQQRPDQYAALEPLMLQQGATLHVAIDIAPAAKISAFLRIDGQSYKLAHVDLKANI